MSYNTHENDGYGIRLNFKTDKEKVNKLIKMSPEYTGKVFALENGMENAQDMDEYIEYCCDCGDWFGCGLAGILAEVINTKEDIQVSACRDLDNNSFLIYEPAYPWYLSKHEKERNLTPEKIEQIMTKYLRILTDENPEFDYQEVYSE